MAKCDYNGFHPLVSVVIAARNEEANIERRIKNIMEQDYPQERLELIIVSDGSSDNTAEIVARMFGEREQQVQIGACSVKLFSNEKPEGKPFSINRGALSAKGEIIVFADCRQRFAKNAIQQLVNNFGDKHVGCVSGELVFEETPGSAIQSEMGAYWNFEKWLRKTESKTGSVPGATGAIYAIRKKIFKPIPATALLDDVLIPMNIALQGFRVAFEPEAIAYDSISKDFHSEKKRKTRTLAGNWQLLVLKPALLSPMKNPLWIRFFSHKIFRLLIPFCLISLLVISLLVQDFYSLLFIVGFLLFLIIASLQPLTGRLEFIRPFTSAFRTILIFNYFAALAPFKLLFSPKHLW